MWKNHQLSCPWSLKNNLHQNDYCLITAIKVNTYTSLNLSSEIQRRFKSSPQDIYLGVNVFSKWITYFFTHNLYIYQYFPNNLIYIWMLHLCKNCCIWIRYPWQRLYFQERLSRFQVHHIDRICHSQSNLLYWVS